MIYRAVTHCHSLYSFDSELAIKDIISECVKNNINAIVICDHDCFGMTEGDERSFIANGILPIRAIEFTTDKGVHIIGVSSEIKTIERQRGFYTIYSLIDRLQGINANIIIPHPDHLTGIIGNEESTEEEIFFAVSSAKYIEVDNYNYGKTVSIERIKKINNRIVGLSGSDAHIRKDVISRVNEFILPTYAKTQDELMCGMASVEIKRVELKRRSKTYWLKKRIKKSKPYQFLLHLFPENMRRRVKRILLKI